MSQNKLLESINDPAGVAFVLRWLKENSRRFSGEKGDSGVGIEQIVWSEDSLKIALTDGRGFTSPNLKGGSGADGRGIEAADLDTDGHLILKLTDGEEIDVGRVVGRDGKDGITQTVVRAGGSGGGSGGSGGSVAPTPAPAERISLIAEQPIIAYKVVTTNDAGQGIYADASTRAHVDQVIGLAATSAAAGSAFEVIESGFVTNSGWSWVAGEPLFLGNTGDIVRNPTAGVFTLQVGYARSSTEIYLRIGRGVLRA